MARLALSLLLAASLLFPAAATAGPLDGLFVFLRPPVAQPTADGQGPAPAPASPLPSFDAAPLRAVNGGPWIELQKPAARRAEGVVMVVHGGAWEGVGAEWVATARPAADRIRALGYATALVDHAPGYLSLRDVTAAYDRLARKGRRVCVYGESAGGHLALLLAARRKLACVIAAAGPTDLQALASAAGESRRAPAVAELVARLFGAGNLESWSPLAKAARIKEPVLAAVGGDDSLVPPSSIRAFAAKAPNAKALVLTPQFGGAPFIHTQVSPAAWGSYMAAERRLLRRALG